MEARMKFHRVVCYWSGGYDWKSKYGRLCDEGVQRTVKVPASAMILYVCVSTRKPKHEEWLRVFKPINSTCYYIVDDTLKQGWNNLSHWPSFIDRWAIKATNNAKVLYGWIEYESS